MSTTIRQLLEAGCHFGHQTRYWCPRMAPFIFGARNKLHIIDLQQTLPMLKEATNFVGSIAAQNGSVLFVGTKRAASKLIRQEAERCNMPYVNHRWLGGMLTNYKTVSSSVKRLKEMDGMVESGEVNRLRKKEVLQFERERAKLELSLSGIKEMKGLPDALFVIDREHEYIAVNEANKLGIPVVAVVDSNCSPKGIDYVIPGNDDAIRAIRLYLAETADAINDAKHQALSEQMAEMRAPSGDVEVEAAEVAVADISVATPKEALAKEETQAAPEAVAEEKVAVEAEPAPVPVVKVAKKKVVKEKVAKKKVAKKKVAKKKVVVKPAAKKSALKADKDGDNLTEINGIGPVIEGKLKDLGISTFAEIAAFDAAQIAEVDEKLAFKGRIEREEWIKQAKKLAK